MGLLSPALSSRGLSIAHKCTAPFRPIPKGLCHKAQGCEPRATLGFETESLWDSKPTASRRSVKMRLPRNRIARVAPLNLKMRKCLIINNRILRFMGRTAGSNCDSIDNGGWIRYDRSANWV